MGTARVEPLLPSGEGDRQLVGGGFPLELALLRCDLVRHPGPSRQPLVMCHQQIVDELPDLIQIQLGCRVRVHHGRVVDVLAVFLHQRARPSVPAR